MNSLRVRANGLDHHVLEWPCGTEHPPRGTVLLVHGYMDAAGTWDLVAPRLATAGYRVLAPDMRGFGDGARAPEGAYYHFTDYAFDLADLVAEASPEPVSIVGHSMGGNIATIFSGAFPERVARFVSLEGLGPPDNPVEVGPIRVRRWIDGVRAARARQAIPTFSREEALLRLAANHANVPREVLAHRLPHLVADAGDGRVRWRFDPLHRTTSPVPFFARLFSEFAKKITCPVLYVSGGPTGYHPPDEDERLLAYPNLTREEIPDAGHMMHWTRPDELVRLLLGFLSAVP